MSAKGGTRRIARIATRALAVAWFSVLLFWVCQPYPTTAPRRSDGWIPLEVDGGTGRVKLQAPAFERVPSIGETRWLLDATVDELAAEYEMDPDEIREAIRLSGSAIGDIQ